MVRNKRTLAHERTFIHLIDLITTTAPVMNLVDNWGGKQPMKETKHNVKYMKPEFILYLLR